MLVAYRTSALDRGRVSASDRVQRVCEMDLVAITLIFLGGRGVYVLTCYFSIENKDNILKTFKSPFLF